MRPDTNVPAETLPFRGGGGATSFEDVERATTLATQLVARGGLAAAAAEAEFARLLDMDGTSLYLQIDAPTPGASLSLVQHDAAHATLCVPQAFCCGAAKPRAKSLDRAHVMVLWCQSLADQRFEAACPTFVRRITVVANGRMLHVEPADLPLSLDLVTA